jgi:uncharacterized membrane protein YedE/YeeE
MTIDWPHFTPYSALAGGAIIGGAVALLLLFNGRIAGISGITGGVLSAAGWERGWRAAFIGGLLLSPWLYAAAATLPSGEIAIGNGGQRLHQRARRMRRRTVGAAFAGRHGGVYAAGLYDRVVDALPGGRLRMLKTLLALLSGIIFGLGLIVAGMANPAKVLAFLDVTGVWDPSLALVMAGAIAVAAPAFLWARGRERSLLGETLQIPAVGRLDRRLLVGSALFGIGWGIAGICPGPAWVLAGAEISRVWPFLLAMLAGMALYDVIMRRRSTCR